jgi:arsenite-transporting ATPase
VGKTTISAGIAYAMRRAQPAIPVMICSTDPAPSLDDVFEQPVGPVSRPVLKDPRLRACEIDAIAEFRSWTGKLRSQLLEGLSAERGGLHVELSFEQEMLSALLDIVPPGVDEIFAVFKILDLLEASPSAQGKMPALVIDMAPTGHALELLKTPERLMTWSRLLLKSLAAHRKLPLAQELGVEVAAVSQRARELRKMLGDRRQCRIFTVMLAEPLPDRETVRLLAELATLKLAPLALFVNRLLFPEEARGCKRCFTAMQWQMATLAHLNRNRTGILYAVPDFPRQISGKSGLSKLTRELWRIEPEPQPERSKSARRKRPANSRARK